LFAADYWVRPKFRRTPGIQRVTARADAARDAWIGEQDYEQLNKILKDPRNVPQIAPALKRFARLTLAELKIVGSDRASADVSEAPLRVRVELGGFTADGKRLCLLTQAQAVFRKSADGWSLGSFHYFPWRENSAAAPFFTDVTDRALGGNASFERQLKPGLDHWRTILDEATGVDVYGHNGLAVGDYNGDGHEDLYVCQPAGLPNRLYRNNGDGTFSDTTDQAGVAVMDHSSMALFADLDNDGDQDLIVVTTSKPLLFVNHGGQFRYEAESGFGITARRDSTLTSAALGDFDRDGLLDLYVCAYDFYTPGSLYDAPTPYYDATNGPPNYLFRNKGGLRFEDATARSGMNENNNRFSFAAAWGDYDNDGFPDLYVANDFGRNNLYRNNGDGTFRDAAAQAGVEDLGAGMSAAWADYDNDGDLDLYVGNMWSSAGQRVTSNPAFASVAPEAALRAKYQRQARGNSLYRNNGDGTFTDVTMDAGVEMGRWAWSSDFVDFDNDGHEDLFIQNGYVTGPDTHDL
jgi:hypothetical protein